MLGINNIGIYLPEKYIDNLSRADVFGKDVNFIKDKIGFEKLLRKEPDEETSDMCVKAYEDLLSNVNINNDIDCLIVCTQTPDGNGLPHTSAIVHKKLGLSNNVACFDISLGCSGYVYGLSVIHSFMDMHGMRNGLLFTSDPYSKVLNSMDGNTELLFGDAATVTYINTSPKYIFGRPSFGSDGHGSDAIMVANDNRLHMNGRNVFMFAMKTVPDQIEDCLKMNNLSKENIDIFLLHQGSKFIVDNLCSELNVSPDRVPFMSKYYGNTVSSSIPIMLKGILEENYNNIVISGFGVGLSWATNVLHKVEY